MSFAPPRISGIPHVDRNIHEFVGKEYHIYYMAQVVYHQTWCASN